MNIILRYLLFIIIFFTGINTYAQGRYMVTGIVADEKGQPLKSATVFISGSEKITASNDEGRFKFIKMDPGTFLLSVTMIGFAPYTHNVIIQGKSVDINITLKVKSIVLDEVFIGSKEAWQANFELFGRTFLGTSKNAKECVILNPKIINFSTKKGLLMADADEFLIIENKRLGYRVKYLLKDFGYNSVTDVALYNGETNFEELPGTPKMQKEWAKNRLETYKGSFMHFLRSVYYNTTLKEGFLSNHLFIEPQSRGRNQEDVKMIVIEPRPVKFDTLVTIIDTSFISLKFSPLYVIYDPKKVAAVTHSKVGYTMKQRIKLDDEASVIKTYLKEAIVDRTGNYTDFRDFFIEGYLARKRVGDQLPFEYQPLKK